MIEELRASWDSGMSCEQMIALRDRLQEMLEGILTSRNIVPATMRCPCCGTEGPGGPPVVSVRAMLLSLRRFEIESPEAVRSLEKLWADYRKAHDLDLYGKPAVSAGEGAMLPTGHTHGQ
jgi:hypothetical protein